METGFVGTPYIFNGYEQNSQWIDPATPMRQVDPDADQSVLTTSSIEGYGAPIIDIMHEWVGAQLNSVVGTMRNFVPERLVRATGKTQLTDTSTIATSSAVSLLSDVATKVTSTADASAGTSSGARVQGNAK